MSTFSANVRYYRLKRGMSQRELAEAIDVSQVVIQHYETEKITPKPTTFVNLAHALGVTCEQLVSREENDGMKVSGETIKPDT